MAAFRRKYFEISLPVLIDTASPYLPTPASAIPDVNQRVLERL
jgi:hypothetical protein